MIKNEKKSVLLLLNQQQQKKKHLKKIHINLNKIA